MADLRTRIAAVLRLHQWRATVRMSDDDPALDCTCGMAFGPHYTFDCYREHVADAVIKELDSEWSIGDDHDGRVLWDNYDEAVSYQYRKGEPLQHRYVTQWRTVDE